MNKIFENWFLFMRMSVFKFLRMYVTSAAVYTGFTQVEKKKEK